jgi:hypothetical protein
MAFHPETRHHQAVTPGGPGATLRPGVCLGGARIRVPSVGKPGIPPETSNFYCLPGRAGGTPNVLDRLRATTSRKGLNLTPNIPAHQLYADCVGHC